MSGPVAFTRYPTVGETTLVVVAVQSPTGKNCKLDVVEEQECRIAGKLILEATFLCGRVNPTWVRMTEVWVELRSRRHV